MVFESSCNGCMCDRLSYLLSIPPADERKGVVVRTAKEKCDGGNGVSDQIFEIKSYDMIFRRMQLQNGRSNTDWRLI